MIRDIIDEISGKEFKDIGDRMKFYEGASKKYLEPKVPTIIRIDGRSFKEYTQSFKKPFDDVISNAMKYTAVKLCEEVQNVKLAYSQSDEITLVLLDDGEKTQQWFGGRIDKILSVVSSIATYYFNDYMDRKHWLPKMLEDGKTEKKPATFDAKVFQVPNHEIINSLIWRQKDAMCNSVLMYARTQFSQKELDRKTTAKILEMLSQKNVDWHKEESTKQRGFCVVKEFYVVDVNSNIVTKQGLKIEAPESVRRSRWNVDDDIPIFSKDKPYLEHLIKI